MKIISNYSKILLIVGVFSGALAGCGISPGYFASENYVSAPVVNYDVTQREKYSLIEENGYHTALTDPLSTFSVDVDTASYSRLSISAA